MKRLLKLLTISSILISCSKKEDSHVLADNVYHIETEQEDVIQYLSFDKKVKTFNVHMLVNERSEYNDILETKVYVKAIYNIESISQDIFHLIFSHYHGQEDCDVNDRVSGNHTESMKVELKEVQETGDLALLTKSINGESVEGTWSILKKSSKTQANLESEIFTDSLNNTSGRLCISDEDDDGDGVINKDDECKDIQGVASLEGCPFTEDNLVNNCNGQLEGSEIVDAKLYKRELLTELMGSCDDEENMIIATLTCARTDFDVEDDGEIDHSQLDWVNEVGEKVFSEEVGLKGFCSHTESRTSFIRTLLDPKVSIFDLSWIY